MSIKNDVQVRKDHEIIRNNVGYYDFTHQMIEVTGPQKGAFMDRIFSNSMESMEVGQAKYTQMLDEKGLIIDDLIVFRVTEEAYWISTLYIDQMKEVFEAHVADFEVEYKDITNDYTMYAVQGPNSRKVLNKFVDQNIDDMKWFTIAPNQVGEIPIYISRAGFTGELGFEVFVNPSQKEAIENKIIEAGKEFGIENTTSDAILSSLPREKGYVLMSDVAETYPLETGFGWAVDWETDFIGKEALAKVKEAGTHRRLYGFELVNNDVDEPAIKDGDVVTINGEEVGKVTTITYGFTVNKFIGYALVDKRKAKIGDQVTINDVQVQLVDRMFYDKDNARLTQ